MGVCYRCLRESDHVLCPDCGKPALEWNYEPPYDPRELLEEHLVSAHGYAAPVAAATAWALEIKGGAK